MADEFVAAGTTSAGDARRRIGNLDDQSVGLGKSGRVPDDECSGSGVSQEGDCLVAADRRFVPELGGVTNESGNENKYILIN